MTNSYVETKAMEIPAPGDATPAVGVTFDVDHYPLYKISVTNVLNGVTNQVYVIQVSEDGSTWTTLTNSLGTDLTAAAIGTAGTVTETASTTSHYYFAKPRGLADAVDTGAILTEERELLFARYVRVYWSVTTGATVDRVPTMSVTFYGLSGHE